MKRILVIDDNTLNNKVYTDPLEKKYQVDIVMSLISVIRKSEMALSETVRDDGSG